ncbi:hypothetical protein [Parafrankia sp. BMG5.11]|uniref:hypothetical protein n=1 Tax=Parafrankia sp. BMG5.11 TaxID=222540 RepID=UPI00103C9F9E|nr:hypothetical protein [Parafrankia sp. BMG5.11]TCJ32430.1 hypothetical protein E0504_42890 [Parafrankia sp. BMG5.11]
MGTTTATSQRIGVETLQPFSPTWERIPGVTVNNRNLVIDPEVYFFRRSEQPVWMLVDWDRVVEDLLPREESDTETVEQQALDFVRVFGQRTNDAAKVLRTAEQVYSHLFAPELLDTPDLAGVTEEDLRILRESATLAALNRVDMSGEISDIGPAWFFPATARVVFDLSPDEAERIDDLYHGGFFNEYRRVDAVKAHAALGGRLVHGCQSAPNMSGGAVVPFGVDLARFRGELGRLKHKWITSILALAGPGAVA